MPVQYTDHVTARIEGVTTGRFDSWEAEIHYQDGYKSIQRRIKAAVAILAGDVQPPKAGFASATEAQAFLERQERLLATSDAVSDAVNG